MEQGEIILYQPDEAVKLEVRLEDETVWLTQAQLVELFQSSKANISEHIKNILYGDVLVYYHFNKFLNALMCDSYFCMSSNQYSLSIGSISYSITFSNHSKLNSS